MRPLFRILYKIHRFGSWVNYHGRRRLTLPGLVMMVVMGVAIMLAPDVDNNFAYQVFALTFCTLLISFLFGWRFRGSFSAERHLPRFGTVGKPVYYSATVRNLGRRPQAGLSILETLVDPRPAFPDWFEVQLFEERQLRSFRPGKRSKNPNPYKLAEIKEAPLPEMPPCQEVQAQLQLVPLRRGILRFASITLASTDPFGLCRAIRKLRLPQTMVVLPKRYRIPSIALPGNIKYQEGGVAMASKVGQSEEFVSLRDYRYGDPPRHIHWRSWAKSGKPVVKEFEDEFFVRHALILDTFSDRPYSQAFEEAVSVAASFACTLDTQDSLLDLLFVGPESFCFTAGRGLAHADQMLEVLASVRPCAKQPFSTLENLVLERVGVVSGCVCVLLAWDAPRRALMSKLEALGLPVTVIIVMDPGAPKPDSRGVSRPERFHVLETGNVEAGLSLMQ